MSKYEPRVKEIRELADAMNWKISWRRRGSRVYVTVITKDGNPLLGGYDNVREFLQRYYKNVEITAGGYGRWHFLVYDLIELLKGECSAD
jgi:hypothetical protein